MRAPLDHPAAPDAGERSLLDCLARRKARPGLSLPVQELVRACTVDDDTAYAALSALSRRGWIVLDPPGHCRLTWLGYTQL